MKKVLLILLCPLIVLAQEPSLIGDVDCSGEVNSEDASLILQFVTNVIDGLPCQDNMTGLTPEQLQEIINMIDEQLSINYSGGGVGSGMPIMISSISSETMYWGDALIYCDELEENGYSDWVLPNSDQLVYSFSGGCELPDERTESLLWTGSKLHYNGGNIVAVAESGVSGMTSGSGSSVYNCRCVRFGEDETSEDSGGSSGSGSSVGGSSEQPITMIGPMYQQTDFPDFIHLQQINNGVNYDGDDIFYFDALLFCEQLVYNDYDDWSLPTAGQLQKHILANWGNLFVENFSTEAASFWLKSNFESTNGNDINEVSSAYIFSSTHNSYPNRLINLFASGLNSNSKHCFCVR